MVLRFILLLLITTSIYAKEKAWYSKIDAKVEAGMYLADFDGTHSTSTDSTVSDFRDDFGYTNTSSSYFSLNIKADYPYVPNIDINYFKMDQTRDATLSENIQVVYYDFNGPISTLISYEVANVVLSYEVMNKGSWKPWFGMKLYFGDLKYAVGINLKSIDWNFQIIDRSDSTATYKFIRVQSSLPIPYVGLRYYFYRLSLYANVSAIAFADAKTLSYEAGLDIKVVDNFYLCASYMYEGFEALEKQDTIKFQTTGNKFSFKYKF